MFKEDHLSFRQRKYMKVKNIIGRALGGIGLVVLSPVYLAIIVAIKKEDGITAPVFFSQKRVGIHKEYFNLYKFRSMRTDTPHDKPTHLLENPDQYITKVGHFLRKSSLDELPQLWNIARGDMAVIGPRPALWNQDDLIAERDKYGANDVKPGLTGWAQINGRDELEIPVKARLDGEYVKKMGPLMDIRCFIGTVFSVLRSDGVVEGGTGAKKKLMVITNHSYMLWQFRRELIGKLMEDYDVIISTPFVGHEDDFKAMGCTMIETDVDRRGINPKTDMKLYLTYRRLLKEHHPDMVVTYSIKPNVYAGYACRQMRIPYCVNVQGLGTAFQKKGLREIVIRMYKTALKKAKTVYFENKGNAKVFLQEQIIRREQMCLLKGAGVNLKYYTYQKYPENDKVHFLYLGRIMKEKGMDELFYAAKELQRKEVPFVLDLVGFFEDEYKLHIDTGTFGQILTIINKMPSVADSVRVSFGTPNHAGLYTVTAVTDSKNYETGVGIGTLLVKMRSKGVKLNWNARFVNGKITAEEAKNFDFKATLSADGAVTIAQDNVHYLYSGFTSKWKIYSSTTTPPTEPGSYVMTVVTLGGDYQAAPIKRGFKITK